MIFATKSTVTRVLRRVLPRMDREPPLLLIERTDSAYYVRMPRQSASSIVPTARSIQLPQPLSFDADSGWQLLDDQLANGALDNSTIVLHPSLYILEMTTGDTQRFPLTTDHLYNNRQSLGNYTLTYARHTAFTSRYPHCQSIIPWAELVRLFAESIHLTPPWIIINDQFLWVLDSCLRLHECSVDDARQLHWLITNLTQEKVITHNCHILVGSQQIATRWSTQLTGRIQVNSSVNSMLLMIQAVCDSRIDSNRL